MVKADWGTATVEPDAQPADVFDPEAMTTFRAMKPLDLSSSQAQLHERLVELLRHEGELFDCGITCPMKDNPETTCSVCPVTRAHETSGSLEDLKRAHLCRIGTEQERVLTLSHVKRDRGL